jgi:hypothetical protein
MRRHAGFRLVQLQRDALDLAPWDGFLIAESDQLLLLQFVSDRYDLDGYKVFRRCDVTRLDEDFPRREMIERALRVKDLSPAPARVGAERDMRLMMAEVEREYGLLTLHREVDDPDVCEIGKVRLASEERYVLYWLDTNGCWEPDDRAFLYAAVTRLDFDGEYERTLLLVAADRANDD